MSRKNENVEIRFLSFISGYLAVYKDLEKCYWSKLIWRDTIINNNKRLVSTLAPAFFLFGIH